MCAQPLTNAEDKEPTWMMAAGPQVYSALNPGQTGGFRPYTPPLDQGSCSTCVSHAVAAAAMASVAHALKRDASKLRDLSPQDLHYCGDVFVGCGTGRRISEVLEPLETLRQKKKLRTTACLPYTPRMRYTAREEAVCTPRQRDRCQQPREALNGRFLKPYRLDTDPTRVQQLVRLYGGVVTSFRVFPGFKDFFKRQPKAVYRGPTAAQAQQALSKQQVEEHAVVVVGYDNRAGFWQLRNSWGPRWGDGGYFRVSYDAQHVGLFNPGDTYAILWQPARQARQGRRLQGAQQLQPAPGKPEDCFNLKAGPRDWLADLVDRYQLPGITDLINNNTQVLTRLDEAPIGKTLLLCGVDPTVAAAVAPPAQQQRTYKLTPKVSELLGSAAKGAVVDQRGKLPQAGPLKRVCVRTDGSTVYALQTEHGGGGLVTIGSGQQGYRQCLDLMEGEVITRVGVNAGEAGLTAIKLHTNRRSTILGDAGQCSGFRGRPCTPGGPHSLCRRRLQAPFIPAGSSFRRHWYRFDGDCKYAEPPEGAAFAAGFKVFADNQRVVGLQVHWGLPA